MTKVCTRCGAPENGMVCRRMDGSSMFALDLDLAIEQPATWTIPMLVRITPSGMCRHCARAKLAETWR